MRLYEYEGKQLLTQAGIQIPQELQRASLSEIVIHQPSVVKAQVLFGNRKQANLIHLVENQADFEKIHPILETALEKSGVGIEKTDLVVEEQITFHEEVYIALRYDTRTRLPVLLFTAAGGSGIEDRSDTESLQTFPLTDLEKTVLPELHPKISAEWIQRLITVFFEHDMTLLEINPLVFVGDSPVALDAKVELDDTAHFRHPEWENYPARTLFDREPTEREKKAKQVNSLDHRGVAGAAYFEFPGTVGILASGGGASLLAMDALLTTDLRPANYTEYSGNPTREKVQALSEIVMSQKNLEGLWVIGGHANFTDIYETLMGVMDAVESAYQSKKIGRGFPIVIRRGGPRQEEAFTALRQRAQSLELSIDLFDSTFPITDTVAVLEEKVHRYQKQKQEA